MIFYIFITFVCIIIVLSIMTLIDFDSKPPEKKVNTITDYNIRYSTSSNKYYIVTVFSDGTEKPIRKWYGSYITYKTRSLALIDVTKLKGDT